MGNKTLQEHWQFIVWLVMQLDGAIQVMILSGMCEGLSQINIKELKISIHDNFKKYVHMLYSL